MESLSIDEWRALDITADWQREKARADAVEAELAKQRELLETMLEQCEERLDGLISAYEQEQEALSGYFAMHGAEHSDEDCPEDDTCSCPEHEPLRVAWARMASEIELAHRRIDKIKIARKTLRDKNE